MFVGSSLPSTALALRKRSDLVVVPSRDRTRRFWTVKDPLTLKFYQLRPEEYAVFEMLDGRTSLDAIRRRFTQRFAPRQLSAETLNAFLARLHRDGLVVADAAGQGEELLARHRRERMWKVGTAWANVLSIRFRGLDPRRFIDWLYPKCRWMFSPGVVAGCVLLLIAALLLVVVHFDQLTGRLPSARAFFSTENLLPLMLALAVVKILHELGHAVTCRHFGGRCHELGLMLLVFTPCLYCNVSDAWLMAGRRRRIAIAGAGMFVELVLAALATFLWWNSQPGLLNTIALNTMFICSVSTLLVNGNPLLRYDGYYVLSDLVRIPNLAQQSRSLLAGWLGRVLLGIDASDDDEAPLRRRLFLAVYGLLSIAYRLVVIVAILWLASGVLAEYRLEPLAHLLLASVVGGLLLGPLLKVTRMARSPVLRRQVQAGRAALSLIVAMALIAFALLAPLPMRVTAPAMLQPAEANRLYVSVPGRIVEALPPGSNVQANQPIARLINHEVALDIARLTGERNRQARRLDNLRTLRRLEQIAEAAEALEDMNQRLAKRQADAQALTLRAPTAGTLLPPPWTRREDSDEKQLPAWHGTPLDSRNIGAFVETDTLIGLIGEPHRVEALLVVEQGDIELVAPGQRVRLAFDPLPATIITGTVAEIGQLDVRQIAPELLAEGRVAAREAPSDQSQPAETLYQVRVKLDDASDIPPLRSRGRGKIIAEPATLAWRAVRYLRRTFSF